MTTTIKNHEAIGLADHSFGEQPHRVPAETIERLRQEDFEGILLGGPQRVSLDTENSLPLAGIYRRTFEGHRAVDLESRAIITAVCLESNRLYAGPAFRQEKTLLRTHVPAENELPHGFIARQFFLDLKTRIPELRWRPTTYSIALILFDRRSNQVRVCLEEAITDPEVKKFLEQHRRPSYPRPVWPIPGKPYPRYRREPGSPPIHEDIGITISAPQKVLLQPGAKCIVRGSFRLPVRQREVVRPRRDPPIPGLPSPPRHMPSRFGCDGIFKARRKVDVGDPEATAVLPITLLFTGDDLPGPWLLPLQVPTYKSIPSPHALLPVTGNFCIDILTRPHTVSYPQTYAIWAFHGPVISNPCLTTLIRRYS